MADLLTDALVWSDLSDVLYNKANFLVKEFYDAFDKATNLVNEVASQGDIGSLSMTVTIDEIETLNEKRRKLFSFANGVHYEINDLVDNPFCRKLSDVVDGVYDLDPSDIKVTTGETLFVKQVTSLSDLIVSTVSDDILKKNLEDKLKMLDQDKPSATLSEVMKEAIFWEKEYQKAEQSKKIAENPFFWQAATASTVKKMKKLRMATRNHNIKVRKKGWKCTIILWN